MNFHVNDTRRYKLLDEEDEKPSRAEYEKKKKDIPGLGRNPSTSGAGLRKEDSPYERKRKEERRSP